MKKWIATWCLMSVCGTALAANAVPDGVYAGYGDNTNVALKVQGHKVKAVAFNIAHAKKIEKNPYWNGVLSHELGIRGNGYSGTVASNANGKLVVDFKIPTLGVCQRTYAWVGGELQETGAKNMSKYYPCFTMHGATWSWGSDTKSKLTYFGK